MSEVPESLNLKVFTEFPIIRTPRLVLREIQSTDALQIFSMRSNVNVNRFIPRDEMKNETDTKRLILQVKEDYKQMRSIGWAAEINGTGSIIGTCGFAEIDRENLRAEIGGELSPDYWGKNIALEAVKEVIKFGLQEMNLHSIEAKVQAGNVGAVFLLEKLGFVKEGHLREHNYHNGKFSDLLIYSRIKQLLPK